MMMMMVVARMLLLCMAANAAEEQRCAPGYFAGTYGGCGECPEGIECATGVPCAANEIAPRGSARCCPLDVQCAVNAVVDGNRCRCVPLSCPPPTRLVALRSSVTPVTLVCREEATTTTCALGQALDPSSGVCIAVQARWHCAEVGLQQLWRSGTGRFTCVAHEQEKKISQ